MQQGLLAEMEKEGPLDQVVIGAQLDRPDHQVKKVNRDHLV